MCQVCQSDQLGQLNVMTVLSGCVAKLYRNGAGERGGIPVLI